MNGQICPATFAKLTAVTTLSEATLSGVSLYIISPPNETFISMLDSVASAANRIQKEA